MGRMHPLLLVVILVAGCGSGDPVKQPITFNHKAHVEKVRIPCVACHQGVEREAHAGLPALSRCLMCHMKPQGDKPNPREEVIRQLAAAGGPFRWRQVTRNPGHVYFSHAAHVSLGQITCTACHGDVTKWTTPPELPNPALVNMETCMACHRERRVSNSCRVCHD